MRSISLLLVVALTVAGCASDPPSEEPDGDVPDDDLEATETTGIIRGVVVDAAVVPLSGVTVLVEGADRTAQSDAEGRFGFDGLAAGAYQVEAKKPGFTAARTTVTVEAGEEAPDVVRMQLEAIPGYNPYSQTIVHEGFYQCGTSVLVVCGAPGALLPFFGMEDPLGLDSSTATFYFEEQPTFVQTEMVWQPSQSVSDELYFEMEALDEGCTQYPEADPLSGVYALGSASGPSPIRVRVGNASLEEHQIGGEECGIYHSVFASGAQGTDAGASVQQKFTWFISSFYGYEPPEEWWFVDTGERPEPPV